MRIALLSDLHLSVQAMSPPAVDADVLVLAGDLHRPAGAIEWARQFDMPTLFVAGNHGFCGGDLVGTVRALRQHAEGSSVRVLEHDVWHRGDVRFFELHAVVRLPAVGLAAASRAGPAASQRDGA